MVLAKQRNKEIGVHTIKFALIGVGECLAQRSLTIVECKTRNTKILASSSIAEIRSTRCSGNADVIEAFLVLTVSGRKSEPVREGTRITTDIVQAASIDIGDRIGKANGGLAIFTDNKTDVGTARCARRIEDREFEMLAVDRIKVDLRAPERIGADAVERGFTENIDHTAGIATHFDQAIGEQAVGDDRTTGFQDSRKAIDFVEPASGRIDADFFGSRIGRIDALTGDEIFLVGTQEVRRPVEVHRCEEIVRTRFRRRVDDTTGGTTEFGRIAARLHFDSLVEVERYVGTAEIVVEVGDVEAVHVICVFSHRCAADRGKVAERAVALAGARGEQDDRGQVARDRNVLRQFFNVDGKTLGVAFEIADNGGARNNDDIGGRSSNVERNRLACENSDVICAIFCDASASHDNIIRTGRQAVETERAVCARCRGAGETLRVRRDSYGRSRNWAPALVGYSTADCTCGVVLSGNRSGHACGGRGSPHNSQRLERRAGSEQSLIQAHVRHYCVFPLLDARTIQRRSGNSLQTLHHTGISATGGDD